MGLLDALPVVGSLGSSIINSVNQSSENAKNRQFQADQAKLAYQRQVELWNMENQYNTPSAQMARYSAAGLNPNLIYGQQQLGASVPAVGAASSSVSGIGRFDNPFSSVFNNYMAIKQYDLNQENIRNEINNRDALTAAEVDRRNAEAAKLRADTARSAYDLDFEKSVRDIRQKLIELGVPEKDAEIASKRAMVNNLNASTFNLGYQAEFARRSMEGRLTQLNFGNAYLQEQINYLESKRHLTDEERQNLVVARSLLRQQAYAAKLDNLNALGDYNIKRANWDKYVTGKVSSYRQPTLDFMTGYYGRYFNAYMNYNQSPIAKLAYSLPGFHNPYNP